METLIQQWKAEEQEPFGGWSFAHIKGRMVEEPIPWDYFKKAKELLRDVDSVLDMGTGGGERFSQLGSFPKHTVATEGYPPNFRLAKERLEPLGVKVVQTRKSDTLPFKDEEFELVLNRHSEFDPKEVFRILKKGGVFLTQQVGGGNMYDLIHEFGGENQFKGWTLDNIERGLKEAGFKITQAKEWIGKTEFKDVGAIVYFLKAVPWNVVGFSVERYLPELKKLQQKFDRGEKLEFTTVRYFLESQKD